MSTKGRRSKKLEPSPSETTTKGLVSGGEGSGLTRMRTGSLDRLPSLRPKRDLTLGGVPKKTYAPTIPASRRIKESSKVESPASKRLPVQKLPKTKKTQNEKRGTRKGRDIITSASVFSMGPSDHRGDKRRVSAPSAGTFGAELDANRDSKSKGKGFVKSEPHSFHQPMEGVHGEDPIIEEFQSENVEDLFTNSSLPPVQLPLDYSLHTKHRTPVPVKQIGKVIKQEPLGDGGDRDNDVAMETNQEPAPKLVKPDVASVKPAQVKGHQISASKLFTPTENSKGQFLFIQLPDCLPVVMETPAMETNKGEQGSSARNSPNDSKESSKEAEKVIKHATLHDVQEGHIGKLRVYKSGKVKMTLGDVTFDVAMGTRCGFLQELVSIRPDPPQPKMTVLGHLSHRLVCTPDFETMLNR